MVEQWIAWVSSFLLGVSGAWLIVQKFSPKVRKACKITGEALNLINGILDAMEDKKITKDEIELILKKIEELQNVLK